MTWQLKELQMCLQIKCIGTQLHSFIYIVLAAFVLEEQSWILATEGQHLKIYYLALFLKKFADFARDGTG